MLNMLALIFVRISALPAEVHMAGGTDLQLGLRLRLALVDLVLEFLASVMIAIATCMFVAGCLTLLFSGGT